MPFSDSVEIMVSAGMLKPFPDIIGKMEGKVRRNERMQIISDLHEFVSYYMWIEVESSIIDINMTEMTEDVKTLKQSAKAGDVTSQVFLATRYRDGDGVRKSVTMALWWYERASYFDPYADGKPDYLALNYAGLCEELILEDCPPLKRFLLKRLRGVFAVLVGHRHHKVPKNLVGRAAAGLVSFMGELFWEIFMVVAPVLLVALIIALVKR